MRTRKNKESNLEKEIPYKDSSEVKVPEKLIDQVIGQDKAVEIVKKAAIQKRNVLLIGEPGVGKSMIGEALSELLPKENLSDILVYPNPEDENNPIIKEVPAGTGKKIIKMERLKASSLFIKKDSTFRNMIIAFFILFAISTIVDFFVSQEKSDILKAADRISGTLILISSVIFLGLIFLLNNLRIQAVRKRVLLPKLLIDNSNKEKAPFVDATGAHAGALLGDVLHDPYQSGGLGTPAHERVIPGAIHKAHKGVLFIDEIATLKPEMQIELLSAMQKKKYPITGRSPMSAGAMVRTQPVPCDFILVAAGTLDTIKLMHPALRSRMIGYGYEVYMNDKMKDTKENRLKLCQFIAQEVVKDGRIPHFRKDAMIEIIKEARRRAGRKGYLTLKLRDLGGLIRAAGDIAREKGKKLVTREDVIEALKLSKSLEKQIVEEYSKEKREYQVIKVTGKEVGKVNGLAVMGVKDYVGLILPIEATVVKSMGKGKIIATGKLGEIAKEAVKNVSAIIKAIGKNLEKYDIHIQFLQTYEGVEGDSASIAIAVAVISSLLKVPVKLDVALTGSLSIKGEVLPVGGVNAKVKAAKEQGIKKVIVPKANLGDVMVEGIEIIPVSNIVEVLKHALAWKSKKEFEKIKRKIEKL